MREIFDSVGPAAKVVRKILEKHVQSGSVKWWLAQRETATKSNPWTYKTWARKFSSPAQRSVPDYLFSVAVTDNHSTSRVPRKAKFACEFKAPGKTSTEAQLDEQQKMRDAGWDVYECDSVEKFKEIARRYL